jgi:hypothetical protein
MKPTVESVEGKICPTSLALRKEGKRPLGRPRRRWEDGIRIDLREIGLGGVDWIVASAVMNLRVLAPRS